jgi:hypothetical protein
VATHHWPNRATTIFGEYLELTQMDGTKFTGLWLRHGKCGLRGKTNATLRWTKDPLARVISDAKLLRDMPICSGT